MLAVGVYGISFAFLSSAEATAARSLSPTLGSSTAPTQLKEDKWFAGVSLAPISPVMRLPVGGYRGAETQAQLFGISPDSLKLRDWCKCQSWYKIVVVKLLLQKKSILSRSK